MRLINTSTLKLHEFHGDEIPSYAILSHTWGEDEVTFQKFSGLRRNTSDEANKIKKCCSLADEDELPYAWVDTCCIDKTSSSELSEAINSMYKWYANADKCYVWLYDMPGYSAKRQRISHPIGFSNNISRLKKCRWFTRGWTLQELLASSRVVFYNHDWVEIGTKASMWKILSDITGISETHLARPLEASIAQKMSWAADRETTRTEDLAYCLLGLFGVNMPLLYGEGRNSFTRLQQTLLASSDNESIFAWENSGLWTSGLLAQAPSSFSSSGDIVPVSSNDFPRPSYSVTNQGIKIEAMLHTGTLGEELDFILRCTKGSVDASLITIRVKKINPAIDPLVAMRMCSFRLGSCKKEDIIQSPRIISLRFTDKEYPREAPYRDNTVPAIPGMLPYHNLSEKQKIRIRIDSKLEVPDSIASEILLEEPEYDYRLKIMSVYDGYASRKELLYIIWPMLNPDSPNALELSIFIRPLNEDAAKIVTSPWRKWLDILIQKLTQKPYILHPGKSIVKPINEDIFCLIALSKLSDLESSQLVLDIHFGSTHDPEAEPVLAAENLLSILPDGDYMSDDSSLVFGLGQSMYGVERDELPASEAKYHSETEDNRDEVESEDEMST